eukprot:1193404-Prorocentrum_minimum.AAC.1
MLLLENSILPPILYGCTVEVKDGVTAQQNELLCVPTIIAHMMGGVRLGFEGLHGLMKCSQ